MPAPIRPAAVAFTLAALGALAVASPAVQAAEQLRSVPAFNAVDDAGPFHVAIEVGPAQSVRLVGDLDLLDRMTTEVVDGTLHVALRDHHASFDIHGHAPKVVVTVPALRALSLSGAGDARVSHLAGEQFEIDLSGVGNLSADGQVGQLHAHLSGAGNVDTRGLKADQVSVSVSGVGSARVDAESQLEASVSGIGSVTYVGHPKVVNVSRSGLGSVTHGD
jgi:hypothetical protein